MPDQLSKPIGEQIEDQVAHELQQLDPDEKATVAIGAEPGKARIGGAVDLGHGVAVGGHVDVAKGKKPGFFAGLKWGWKRKG